MNYPIQKCTIYIIYKTQVARVNISKDRNNAHFYQVEQNKLKYSTSTAMKMSYEIELDSKLIVD